MLRTQPATPAPAPVPKCNIQGHLARKKPPVRVCWWWCEQENGEPVEGFTDEYEGVNFYWQNRHGWFYRVELTRRKGGGFRAELFLRFRAKARK